MKTISDHPFLIAELLSRTEHRAKRKFKRRHFWQRLKQSWFLQGLCEGVFASLVVGAVVGCIFFACVLFAWLTGDLHR